MDPTSSEGNLLEKPLCLALGGYGKNWWKKFKLLKRRVKGLTFCKIYMWFCNKDLSSVDGKDWEPSTGNMYGTYLGNMYGL